MKNHIKSLREVNEELLAHDKRKVSPQIIAVSKLQPNEKITELLSQGQIDFGENYVQEALLKQKVFKDSKIQWHLIGPLQSKKVKDVVGKFDLIHSVGSLKTARLISQKAIELSIQQRILLQVNLADEQTKSGFSESEATAAIRELKELQGVSIEGLMTLPPLFENPELVRPYFSQLRELRDRLALKELSMGTSADYLIAAEEGATMVRIGSLIFGERPKP